MSITKLLVGVHFRLAVNKPLSLHEVVLTIFEAIGKDDHAKESSEKALGGISRTDQELAT